MFTGITAMSRITAIVIALAVAFTAAVAVAHNNTAGCVWYSAHCYDSSSSAGQRGQLTT
jgi:hypothetical protein